MGSCTREPGFIQRFHPAGLRQTQWIHACYSLLVILTRSQSMCPLFVRGSLKVRLFILVPKPSSITSSYSHWYPSNIGDFLRTTRHAKFVAIFPSLYLPSTFENHREQCTVKILVWFSFLSLFPLLDGH